MRKHLCLLTLSTIVLLCTAWALAGPPIKQSAPGEDKLSGKDHPRAVVTQMEYAFDPVFEGVQIKHDFVVENRGTAPLVIQNVRSDWGCSVASNPGQIRAGGKEVISVVVNTKNRGGSTLRKRFVVKTNDPHSQTFTLVVKGQVRAYIPLTPDRVRLRGRVGEQVQKTVLIERLKDHPFHVKAVKARDGKHLRFELKEGNSGKDGYRLVVTNTMPKAGSYHDLITIETDSKVKPMLRIPVTARILTAAKK